jgi:hypothetical protein
MDKFNAAFGGLTARTLTPNDVSFTVTGYRAPFWGYRLSSNALTDPATLTSSIVRGFASEELVSGYKGGKGTSVGNLPTTYTVPANTK